LTTLIYVRAPPESGEPADAVWAFTRHMNSKADAGRHSFFSTPAKFLNILGLSLSKAFETV